MSAFTEVSRDYFMKFIQSYPVLSNTAFITNLNRICEPSRMEFSLEPSEQVWPECVMAYKSFDSGWGEKEDTYYIREKILEESYHSIKDVLSNEVDSVTGVWDYDKHEDEWKIKLLFKHYVIREDKYGCLSRILHTFTDGKEDYRMSQLDEELKQRVRDFVITASNYTGFD